MAQAKEDLDAEIREIEAMSDEEIDAELRKRGIDPQAAVDTVKKVVDAKLKERKKTPHRKPRPV